jgi:hypothetical protein
MNHHEYFRVGNDGAVTIMFGEIKVEFGKYLEPVAIVLPDRRIELPRKASDNGVPDGRGEDRWQSIKKS